VVVCSNAFVTLAKSQAKVLGCPDLPLAVIPHPFGTRTRDEVRVIAAACADDIPRLARTAAGLTQPAQARESLRAEALEAPPTQEEFDDYCEERGWSDGLPLVPPTRERVARLVEAAGAQAEQIVARVAPAGGIATIERLAVNAAMAGCGPSVFPLLIAAVEALCDPAFNLQGIQTTTNPATPWIVVNGPLAVSLGMNSGINCLGSGNRVNATLGRAVRLVLQNIGGARGGEMDRATHGQPGKYAFCCAENEAANPWQPLHVERGHDASESTVTVVPAAGTLNLNSHTHDAEDLLKVLADTMANPMSNDYWYAGEPWLILAPEHARILAGAGYTKAQVKRRLWEASKLSAARLTAKDLERPQYSRAAELGAVT
jgi:hypothetical protein